MQKKTIVKSMDRAIEIIPAAVGGGYVAYIMWKNMPDIINEIKIRNSRYKEPEDYDIPHAPIDVDENGELWIECENPMKVER